ncbi:Citryl-CoA lyase [Natrinema pellirubrum DSM 15624]|uniref:Citrate lyase beta subunit n=1 Tax=Natrinema pellirubrum (strain DSM 15624 / CIP 106293 / JCM 10476 / NCIMB 786 / 157) TaxID=797303 RepID=L0JN79_NATP1|nr:CoA ester lyase [Natrinema pellirubrum]AGB32724.1 citrate lyase beta subunit [Natrinema pellirubrum DSM 15624]ELY75726.1 Citryl-CoA lyase [Natrinema pellirubrum DSM 15624]
MVRRSVLFAPGDEPEIMRKAATSEADVVVFDLEDAVAPADKAAAREAVRDVLDDGAAEPERCVRVNPVGTSAATDLEAILEGTQPDSVMLPKTESAADVRTVERLFDEYDADLPVLSLIESAAGVLRADEIATAAATDALLFGAEDLAADIGATRTSEGTEVLYARERTVLAASAAGVDAIDTVYTDFTDTDGLRDETAFAARLGYDGKIAIHPAQVPVINDAFTPSDDDVEWAERVLDARDRTDAGVFEVDGEMIDAPLIAQAERILERAEQVE